MKDGLGLAFLQTEYVAEFLNSEDIATYAEFLGIDPSCDFEDPDYIQKALMLEIKNVFCDKDNELLSERKILEQISEYMEVVRAKIHQIDENFSFSGRHSRTEQDFRSSPRTRLKTIQELLTAVQDRQFFHRSVVFFRGEEGLIKDIVIDPRKITDSLLKIFGLDEFILKGRGVPPAAKTKRRAEAIPEIKNFFANGLETLNYPHETRQDPSDQKFFRLFRIRTGKNEGKILGSQENSGKKPFLTDLHSACRRIDHIEESYREEIEKLVSIQGILDDISSKVQSDWGDVKSNLDPFIAQLNGIVDSLQFVKNSQKVKIKEKISKCLTFSDRTGKLNPSSRLAIFVSVKSFVGRRIKEISNIMSHLAPDKTRVMYFIEEQSQLLDTFYCGVEQYGNDLILLNPDKEIDEPRRQKILTSFDVLRTQCENFMFYPYTKLAQMVLTEIGDMIEILKSDNFNDEEQRNKLKSSFVKIYTVAKLLKFENSLIALRKDYFAPDRKLETVYVKDFMRRVIELEQFLKSKNIAPDVEIQEFRDVFGNAYKLLGEIRTIARQGISAHSTKETRVEALKRINLKLKDFDLYAPGLE